MPTEYAGRSEEHDLGDGHSFVWSIDEFGHVYGLIEHHPAADGGSPYCGGYIAWAVPQHWPTCVPRHELVRGGPGEEALVTISPSLACRTCGNHGFIRDGKWVTA